MAIRVESVPVRVHTGWFDGRPREIEWGEQRLAVTGVIAVRDETAAYPTLQGPRTIFEVETPLARLTLAFRHRTRRWAIEALDEIRRAA
jgi:hypothetical protein